MLRLLTINISINNDFVNVHVSYFYTVEGIYTATGQVEAAREGIRADGARCFVVTYVLGVKCVVYVKGLGETYLTLHKRVMLLLLYLLLLLLLPRLVRNGDFKIIEVFNPEKIIVLVRD